MGVTLPPLTWRESPNQSRRVDVDAPWLVVVHRPVGSYQSATRTFLDPHTEASAHILTNSNDGATQFVRWDRKAWTCKAFNSASYNIEVDDDAWAGRDDAALATAARIVAFLCTRTGIPPEWTLDPHASPGVARHADLGRAGGGHSDPTTDVKVWRAFMLAVQREHARGGFRKVWGAGELRRIDV